MAQKKYCKVCEQPMILETIIEGSTTFGRHECRKCNFKESWKQMIIRDIIRDEKTS